MADEKVLVVDDDKKTIGLIKRHLSGYGYCVITAHDGDKGLRLAREVHPAIIILELMLRDINGFEVCHILRSTSDVPIIILTARTTIDDKLVAFALGADDYVTKPFCSRELAARIQAILWRRAKRNGVYPGQ
jgi:DNA-binding response OmpR family regulator